MRFVSEFKILSFNPLQLLAFYALYIYGFLVGSF